MMLMALVWRDCLCIYNSKQRWYNIYTLTILLVKGRVLPFKNFIILLCLSLTPDIFTCQLRVEC
jgi:hypothetical protein